MSSFPIAASLAHDDHSDAASDLDLVIKAIDAANYSQAMDILGGLLRAEPRNAAANWQAGRLLGLNQQYDGAVRAFKNAVQIDPVYSAVEFSFHGHVIRLRDNVGSTAASLVMNELAKGAYNLASLRFNPGDIVVDVGAHIGGISIALAKMHPHITIYAYEPAKHTYDLLCANLEENGIENVIPVQRAVSGINGFLELMWSPYDTSSSGSCIGDDTKETLAAAGWEREMVECVTLSTLLNEHGIERIAWLKLDCEGAEYEIARNPAVLERADKISLELHMPYSRHHLGADACKREFLDLLGWPLNCPHIEITSAMWIIDT